MERKVDGYSVEFDRGLICMLTLGAYKVAVKSVVALASAIIPGVR